MCAHPTSLQSLLKHTHLQSFNMPLGHQTESNASTSAGCTSAGCRPAPIEEVYSFRQVTQFAAFTPETLTHINASLKTFATWQVSRHCQLVCGLEIHQGMPAAMLAKESAVMNSTDARAGHACSKMFRDGTSMMWTVPNMPCLMMLTKSEMQQCAQQKCIV